jgi:hypothetical protein
MVFLERVAGVAITLAGPSQAAAARARLAFAGAGGALSAMLALVVLLALAGCNWDVDPLASLGASLKKTCRSSDSCSTHDPDPGRY